MARASSSVCVYISERLVHALMLLTLAGEEVLDQIVLNDNLVITNQSIGVAIEDEGFDGVDGIIG